MIVLHEPQHDVPLATVVVTVPGGSAADAPGREGLARHAAELMRRGAGGRTRAELDAAFDALGADADVHVAMDSISFTLRCLSRKLDAAVALLADVLGRPALAEGEHEKLRRESLALLDEVRDDDASLATRWFERYALEGHAYGRTPLGTEGSLAALARDQAAAWVGERVTRDRLIVGFAGDVPAARAEALAARLGEALPAGPGATLPAPPAPGFAAARRTILVDKPERSQSQILIGHPGPAHAAPDWLPLSVAATIFGGTFTSRLMTEVRVKRGWSYGAGCRLGKARAGTIFRIRVFPAAEQTPDTLALVLAMWDDIVRDGARQDELDLVKGYLAGSWAFEIDTSGERLAKRIDTLVLGLAPDTYPRYLERLAAVTLDEVNDALRRWWRPDRAAVVVTTTAETMQPRLAGLPLGALEVVPYDAY